jgi:hypothetical protein
MGIGGTAIVLGFVRLMLTVNASLLGTDVDCGNAIGYLSGADNKHPTGMAVCGSALYNVSFEGIVLLLAGGILLIVGIFLFRDSHHVNIKFINKPSPPGWYRSPWHPGFETYWDGKRWTPRERPAMGQGPFEPPQR